jgi:hypothetical protein
MPPPTQGWLTGESDPVFDADRTVFRPSPDRVELVVATTEPGCAQAVMRPLYGDAVCVVPSRWMAAQVTSVRAQADELIAAGMIYGGGTTSSAGVGQQEAPAAGPEGADHIVIGVEGGQVGSGSAGPATLR